jgi:hypothetical protein
MQPSFTKRVLLGKQNPHDKKLLADNPSASC